MTRLLVLLLVGTLLLTGCTTPATPAPPEEPQTVEAQFLALYEGTRDITTSPFTTTGDLVIFWRARRQEPKVGPSLSVFAYPQGGAEIDVVSVGGDQEREGMTVVYTPAGDCYLSIRAWHCFYHIEVWDLPCSN